MLDEYIRVLAYPKFRLTEPEIRGLIEDDLIPFIESVPLPPSVAPPVRDPDDAKFISCALTSGVRWLVSGDDDLLSLSRVKSVEIVTVTTFLQRLTHRP